MRKLAIVLAVLTGATLITGVALADEATDAMVDVAVDRVVDRQETDRAGDAATDRHPHPPYGYLAARGSGTVDIDAVGGHIAMRVSGDVRIEGPAGLVVRINGSDQASAVDGSTIIVLEDFSGLIFIAGRSWTLDVDGEIAFEAVGKGTAVLDGEGVWKTRRARGHWPAQFGT